MIAFVIEYRQPGAKAWQPVGICGADAPDVNELIDYIRQQMPGLSECEIRLSAFKRPPGVHIKGRLLGVIPIIVKKGKVSNGNGRLRNN